MKHVTLFILLLLSSLSVMSQSFNYSKLGPHPRLLLKAGEEQKILKNLDNNPTIMKVHQRIIKCCDEMLNLPTLERKKDGKRLLAVSREALRRVFYLSYAYRMTGENKYILRAEKEMLTLSAFTDWNPSHYLDVAEMTMALAIGYDWLYKDLQPNTKTTVRQAIAEKGFLTSKNTKDAWFYNSDNNWNQVCNAGLVYGALAVFEDEKVAATEIIEKCMETIVKPTETYGPDGNYAEGYMYWGYGTTFEVMLIAALENNFGTDKGISNIPGFLKSAQYIEYMTGPGGLSFNYSDSWPDGVSNPILFWFAKRLKDPSLLWIEKEYLMSGNAQAGEDRLLPCLPIFAADFHLNQITPPTKKIWVGHGKTPVILVRNGWKSKNDSYFGLKGGTASANHAHMDAGSFVFEAMGVRWAMDLGAQGYLSLESQGVSLWDSGQNGQRWDVLVMRNEYHNTLTVNGQRHIVKGFAPIIKTYEKDDMLGGTLDMSGIFAGELKTASRKVALMDGQYLEVTDDVEAENKETVICWTMCTPAEAKMINDHTFELTKNGKKLHLIIDAPAKVGLKTWSNDPIHSYDRPNPDTRRVGFEVKLNPGQKEQLKVRLVPVSGMK
ncbi:MAG: heparinase II/III family protein [Bacteroidales bacterium]|nr:heparinase II/III family protein [Bacteroidales bacterium]